MQGFVLLKGVLSPDECDGLHRRLHELEAADYPDDWSAPAACGVAAAAAAVARFNCWRCSWC